jgi:hypothetical protein
MVRQLPESPFPAYVTRNLSRDCPSRLPQAAPMRRFCELSSEASSAGCCLAGPGSGLSRPGASVSQSILPNRTGQTSLADPSQGTPAVVSFSILQTTHRPAYHVQSPHLIGQFVRGCRRDSRSSPDNEGCRRNTTREGQSIGLAASFCLGTGDELTRSIFPGGL